jgi:hypothetical protein
MPTTGWSKRSRRWFKGNGVILLCLLHSMSPDMALSERAVALVTPAHASKARRTDVSLLDSSTRPANEGPEWGHNRARFSRSMRPSSDCWRSSSLGTSSNTVSPRHHAIATTKGRRQESSSSAALLDPIRLEPANIRAIIRARPDPLPPRVIAEDRTAHHEFVRTLGSKAVWLDYFTVRSVAA